MAALSMTEKSCPLKLAAYPLDRVLTFSLSMTEKSCPLKLFAYPLHGLAGAVPFHD
jgi:hypothetical protein